MLNLIYKQPNFTWNQWDVVILYLLIVAISIRAHQNLAYIGYLDLRNFILRLPVCGRGWVLLCGRGLWLCLGVWFCLWYSLITDDLLLHLNL